MFDIGSSEIFLILLVAIILINPRDLPAIIKKSKVFLQNFSNIKQEFSKTITKLEDTIKQADLTKNEFEEFKKEYLEPLEPQVQKKIQKIKTPKNLLKKSKEPLKPIKLKKSRTPNNKEQKQ